MDSLFDEEENLNEEKIIFKLDNFEGPLDLLSEIIRKNKMDISEVKLADITSQYLAYMEGLEELDMEKASEFIVMAAALIEIKSKSLLPRVEEDVEEEVDEEALILQRIKEYELFKDAGKTLHEIEEVNRIFKAPDEDVGQTRFVLKDMVLDNLLDAFVGILTRVDKEKIIEKPKEIQRDRFTVAEKIASIKLMLKEKKKALFTDLFEEGQTKSELINIFMAILELLKLQFIKIKQNGLFGEITVYLNE